MTNNNDHSSFQSIKVKIAVKGKRLRETPPSSSNKRPRMFHSVESLQTPSLETRQPELPARHAQIPCTATGLQKYINLSPVSSLINPRPTRMLWLMNQTV